MLKIIKYLVIKIACTSLKSYYNYSFFQKWYEFNLIGHMYKKLKTKRIFEYKLCLIDKIDINFLIKLNL